MTPTFNQDTLAEQGCELASTSEIRSFPLKLMKQKVTITTKPGIVKIGDKVNLVKQPTNQFDQEAIAVVIDGPAGPEESGYVSAFYKTRKPGTISAGRIYDRFDFVLPAVVVAEGIVEVELADKLAGK